MSKYDKEKKNAIHEMWRRGNLSWKLDSFQAPLYEQYQKSPEKILTWLLSRRSGKSYTLCVIAIEECLKKPNRYVKYVTSQLKMVRTIIKPLMTKLLEDAPEDVRPAFKTMDNLYVFPNGSEIQLAGSDGGNCEKLRGTDSHLCIIDEAGFCDQLEYVVGSILMPTTTLTRAKIILSSTPPKTYDHEFVKFMQRAEQNGTLIKKNIYDVIDALKNDEKPRMTQLLLEDVMNTYPDANNSSEFQREYMCILRPDESLQIVPEFTEELQKDIITKWPHPEFFDTYVSMDPGFRDLTGVLFAYYDFMNAVIVIEDELVINGPTMTTEFLAEEIKKKESLLWKHPMTGEINEPHMRVSDVNPILLNDLYRLHSLSFFPTQKDDKESALNQMRMKLNSRQICIHPRCTQLIQHLQNGTWKMNKKDFARSADNGHYDLIPALMYLVRNINYGRNPYPQGIQIKSDTFVRPGYQQPSKHDVFRQILGKRKL
jgi:hypothetical protein